MKFFKSNRFLCLLALCFLSGCGSSHVAEYVKTSNDSNIKKMGSAYQLYASRFAYTGPKSAEALKDFLKTNESIVENLNLMGLDREKIDEYFVSENDGKEFQFRWGVYIDPDPLRSKEPLVFEQDGKDGTRLVMLSNRKILEVDNDKKYQKLLRGKVDAADAKTEAEKEEEAAKAL